MAENRMGKPNLRRRDLRQRRIQPRLWALTTVMLLTLLVKAQPHESLFRHINTDQGLSNDLVYCVTQDSYGFIWIGTDDGLNRYNGYENSRFKKARNDTTSIPDNHIVSLLKDNQGRIWVGTLNGLCLYNREHENFTHFIPHPGNSFTNTINRITCIRQDKDGLIYASTDFGCLYRLKNNRLEMVRDFHQHGNIKKFIIDKDGLFWLGTLNGVIRYNKALNEEKQIATYHDKGATGTFETVLTLLEEGDNIWIGTNNGQLGLINKQTLKADILPLPQTKDGLINDLLIDANGNLQIASSLGLFILDTSRHFKKTNQHQQNYQYGSSFNAVQAIYQDRQKNIWYGTPQGLNLVMNNKAFHNYNTSSIPISLDISNIQSMTVDWKGNYWLGSHIAGLNVVNFENGYKRCYMPDAGNPNAIGDASVIGSFEDSRHNMWVGSYLGYLQRYDATSGRFISYPFNESPNSNKRLRDVRNITEDKQGNLWFISHSFGMVKFNPASGQYQYFRHDSINTKHSLSDNWAYQITKDQDSIFWIATPSGLSKFNLTTETFKNYYHSESDSNTLSSNHINTVFCDSKGNLWIGTFYGLDFYDRQNDVFYHYYEEDGLPNNQIKSFVEDQPGKIWMGTGYGLTCMTYTQSPQNRKPIVTFRNYDKSDNLQDVFFWERCAVKHPNGDLAFGTKKGIIVFRPDEISDNTTPPDVYITKLKLFNRSVNVDDSDSILHQPIYLTQSITLKYNQNIITFNYVAINHIAPEKNQYQYKLEGFDTEWIHAGTKQDASYTNLLPGKYVFRVKASNNDGIWNEQGAALEVIVLPPWWQTWWFKALLVITIITLLYLIIRLRTRSYKRRQVILQKMVAERTRLLEETATSLEEAKEELSLQNEELLRQRNELGQVNESLILQSEKILQQRLELEKHQYQLEELVEERTRELKEAKEKAEESDKLKSSFLANFSHEIRTPLNAMLGFSSFLNEKDISEEERLQFIAIIKSNSQYLLELINDILDISKIEAGQLQIALKPVFLHEVVDNLALAFEKMLQHREIGWGKAVDLKVDIPPSILMLQLLTDRVRLEQILSNLLSNAVKFTQQGSIVIIAKIVEHSKFLEISVSDTGIGIKEEHLDIIFERFRKIEDDTINLYRGNGLGLAITSKLVQMLGGTIRVESEYGKGSTFSFTIPI